MQKNSNKIKNIISIGIIIVMLIIAYQIYQKYNFNEFVKAEHHLGISKFERDNEEKCIESNSYKAGYEIAKVKDTENPGRCECGKGGCFLWRRDGGGKYLLCTKRAMQIKESDSLYCQQTRGKSCRD